MRLNTIFLKACERDIAKRYATAAELRDALLEAEKVFARQPAGG